MESIEQIFGCVPEHSGVITKRSELFQSLVMCYIAELETHPDETFSTTATAVAYHGMIRRAGRELAAPRRRQNTARATSGSLCSLILCEAE
jgi:hypothetical protein